MDEVIQLTSAALNQGRDVQCLIEDQIIPTLNPARRTFAMHLSRQIRHGDIFDEQFLHDLESFVCTISQMVDDETFVGWEADEHHVNGGFDFIYMSSKAKALAPIMDRLQSFRIAVAQVLDAVRAINVASKLVST